jgi:opacity protein-like surface antigen
VLATVAALALQLGISANQQIGAESELDYRETVGVSLSLGSTEAPLYGWGSLSKGKHYILGQPTSSAYTAGLGLGYQYDFNDTFYVKLEAGVGYPHIDSNKSIQQEAVYTYLVRRHNVPSRPIPVNPLYPYDQESYETTWELDYGFMGRVGLGINATESWRVELSYKYFNPKGLLEIYDQELRDAGGGWWQEYASVNMNAVEFGIRYEF